jgi:hypothetical protein
MTQRKSIPVEQSFAEWRRDSSYINEYEALEKEFARAAALIDARDRAGSKI